MKMQKKFQFGFFDVPVSQELLFAVCFSFNFHFFFHLLIKVPF